MLPFRRYFYTPYLIFLAVALAAYLMNGHGAAVLWINARHTELLNYAFVGITFLGDGIFLALVAVALLVVRRRHGLILALAGVIQAVVSFVMKKFIFNMPRPKKYFDGQETLNFIEGVSTHSSHSFPSGHTMTAFMLATFLCLFFRSKSWSLILIILAVLVGYSRIYLLQHFLIDVMAGSAIGILLAELMNHYFSDYLQDERSIK